MSQKEALEALSRIWNRVPQKDKKGRADLATIRRTLEQLEGRKIEGWAHTGEHFVRFVANAALAEDRTGYGVMIDFEPALLIIKEAAIAKARGEGR